MFRLFYYEEKMLLIWILKNEGENNKQVSSGWSLVADQFILNTSTYFKTFILSLLLLIRCILSFIGFFFLTIRTKYFKSL